MADLTDVTITPMIAIGIGAVMFATLHYTDWGWPVAAGLGLTIGPVVGFGAGMLLTLIISIPLEILWKIGEKRRSHKASSRRDIGP